MENAARAILFVLFGVMLFSLVAAQTTNYERHGTIWPHLPAIGSAPPSQQYRQP